MSRYKLDLVFTGKSGRVYTIEEVATKGLISREGAIRRIRATIASPELENTLLEASMQSSWQRLNKILKKNNGMNLIAREMCEEKKIHRWKAIKRIEYALKNPNFRDGLVVAATRRISGKLFLKETKYAGKTKQRRLVRETETPEQIDTLIGFDESYYKCKEAHDRHYS